MKLQNEHFTHLLLQGAACREQMKCLPDFWIFYTLKLTWRKNEKNTIFAAYTYYYARLLRTAFANSGCEQHR